MKVSFDDLRQSLELVLSELESEGIHSFELDADYYWDVTYDERYRIYEEPQKFAVGDLSHDFERLDAIRAGEDYPIRVSLVWLGQILRAIGERGTNANDCKDGNPEGPKSTLQDE